MIRGNFRLALDGIRSSKWRSFLTIIGIIVGVVSVVLVVGIGEGIKRQISGALDQYGKDLIIVRPKKDTSYGNGGPVLQSDVLFGMSTASSLSLSDVDTIDQVPGVGLIAPLGLVSGAVEADGQVRRDSGVIGTSSDMPTLLKQDLAYGAFWTSDQEESKFAVLGKRAAQELFEEPAPLGKTLIFRGQSFQVRGVFEPFKEVPFSPTSSFDDMIFIPGLVASDITSHTVGPYVILVKPAEGQSVNELMLKVQKGLQDARGGEKDVEVVESAQSLGSGNGTIDLLTTWIFALAAISLLMGGIGIMNIMLLVVTERMHEIGVRKAVGATSRQILGQFVMEATVLSVLGGLIGTALSLAAVGLIRVYTDLDAVISWPAVGIVVGASIAIGIVFGSIPAIKAARKDPIEALRHE